MNAPPSTTHHTPLRELLTLAVPTILQMASYTLMQFADTYMLSLVGDLEATAAGQAGGVQFAFVSFGFGIMFLVNALVSQAYGRGAFAECGRVLWQGIYVAIGCGLVLLVTIPFAPAMFARFGHEPRLVELEAIYFQILTAFAVFKLVQSAMSQFLIGINRPGIVLLSAVVGTLINVFFNWVLIYGNLGFAPMGIAGAAIATVISILIELLIMLVFFASRSIRKRYNPFDWKLRPDVLGQLLKLGTPAGAAMVGEVGAWSLFNVWVIGQFGTDAMKANNYAFRYMLVAFMPAIGIGHAVTALVGRYYGAGDIPAASRRAHLGFRVAAAYMVLVGIGMMVFGRHLVGFFTNDPAVIAIGATIILFMGGYQILDAVYVVYIGALRGAGDTFIPSMFMIVLNWTLVVAGAYLTARHLPQLGPGGPWTVLCIYGICVGAFMFLRFQHGAWRRI
jgi:MATE family multidrug resistance protein